MIVGGLRSVELMEEILRNKEADLISLSRPLIRNPGIIKDWEKGGRHRAECISCNKCLEGLRKGEKLQVYPTRVGKTYREKATEVNRNLKELKKKSCN